MPRHKTRRKQAARPSSPHCPRDEDDAEILVADPNWVDISDVPVDAGDYHVFEPPRVFFDEMLADRNSWAMGADFVTAKCVASALWRTTFPWLADYQQWRRHVGEFLDRLCSHRAHRAGKTQERFAELESQLQAARMSIAELRATLDEVNTILDVTRDELNRTRGQVSQLAASFRPVQELALLRPSSVIADDAERIRRAQHRAISARSPDPRTATAAMRRVERMDREAIARYEQEVEPWELLPTGMP